MSALQRFIKSQAKQTSNTSRRHLKRISATPSSKQPTSLPSRNKNSVTTSLPTLSHSKPTKSASCHSQQTNKILLQSKIATPIRFTKNMWLMGDYSRMPSAMSKSTDRFINEINNIRFVEKLLLMKPTNGMTKRSHQQFYEGQSRYRKNLQVHRPVAGKKRSFRDEREWLS